MARWTPNSFRVEGDQRGYDSRYLAMLVAEGQRLRGLNLPVLFTLGHLVEICDEPYQYFAEVIRRRLDPYRVFRVRKQSGGYRTITVPDAPLLKLQRWIHQNILLRQTPHPASTAFSPACSPKLNAEIHAGARWLVKIDVTDFFEAISERQVYKAFRRAGYRALLAFQLGRLCTRLSLRSLKYRKPRWKSRGLSRYAIAPSSIVGHLPQGSPTSPMLANLVCRPLDEELNEFAQEQECTYSRYADDIVFSSSSMNRSQAAEIIRTASKILGGHGLTRNRQKTQIVPPGARRMVTGLLVDRDSPKLSRDFRERVELHLFHAQKHGIRGHCERRGFRSLLGFRSHLHGLVCYGEYVEPQLGALWRTAFDQLPWGDLSDF